MQAAVLHRPMDLRVETVKEPAIRQPDDVLLRMRRVGVCGSDVHYYVEGRAGTYVLEKPMIVGHECAAEVVGAGPQVTSLRPGDRVAIEPGVPCRKCRYCHSGRYNLCADVEFMATPPFDGGLAEFVVWPADFLFKLPDSLSLDEGALMEPLATGVSAARRGEVGPGQAVAIIGAGPIGLMAMHACLAFGATRVIACDTVPFRLEKARSLGAELCLDPGRDDVLNAVEDLTGGEGPDVVIEAAGSPEATRMATNLVRRGGIVVLVGIAPEPEFPIDVVSLVQRECDVRGVFRYANAFPTAIALCAAGRVRAGDLITHRFPLARAVEAFELARTGKDRAIKVMIEL